MNLISCTNCGIILNKDYLNFPQNLELDTGGVNLELVEWVDGIYISKMPCPVCQEFIFNPEISY